jgi:hypothetical protein
MPNSASQKLTRTILRKIVNACANEIAASHSDSEPSTKDETSGDNFPEDEDVAVQHLQDLIEEESARDEEQEQQRKIEQAILNLEATYLKMETRKLKFRRIEEDLANARHQETMETQKNMCNLIANAITDAVTSLEPRGA